MAAASPCSPPMQFDNAVRQGKQGEAAAIAPTRGEGARTISQTGTWFRNVPAPGGWEKTMLKHREVADWLDERQERFITISDTIWEYAEVALAETKSCQLQADDLEA